MLRSGFLLSLALVGAAAEAEGPRPLAIRGNAAAEAVHALVAVADGDSDAIVALPRELFHAEVAVADEGDADLGRRWTLLLPRALARATPEARERALAALDAACRADLAAEPPTRRALDAIDFLPAPSARAALEAAAARAFDHGRFADALLDSRLLGGDDETRRERDRVARLLTGRAAEIDPALALVEPGLPTRAHETAAPAEQSGLAVRWATSPGWVLACDGGGRVLWQYRVDLGAEVLPGAGAALVRDGAGLRALDEDGRLTPLTPPPGDTRCLAVAGGAAWFATGARAWRLPLAGGGAQSLDLGGEPLCPPLVRGERSLWLTRAELRLFEREAPLQRMRHFLGAREGWRLGCADGHPERPLVVAPDGAAWAVEPFAAQLAAADALGRARLLVQASRADEALAELARDPHAAASADGKAVAFAAHAGLGAQHVATHAEAVAALAATPAERAAVRYVAFRAAPADDQRRARAQELVTLLRAHPEAWISWSPLDLATDAADWAHASDGAALADAIERWFGGAHPSREPEGSPAHVVADEAVDAPAAPDLDEVVSDVEIGRAHRWRGTLVQLDHGSGWTRLACRDADSHRMRWSSRWDADAGVPSRALAIADGWALVSEGVSRLVAVDAGTGERRLIAAIPGVAATPSRARMLAPPLPGAPLRLAVLGPLDDELALVDAPASATFGATPPLAVAERIALPAHARWLVPLPPFARALVLLDDGRALLYPGAVPVSLPAPLNADGAPAATEAGLLKDGKLWRWSE